MRALAITLAALMLTPIMASAQARQPLPIPPTDGAPVVETSPAAEVSAVLDALHGAAARADGPAYFALFTPDAVYIGTDASERWTLAQFRAFAEPYFGRGRGWTYTLRPGTRHVALSPGGGVAWFDELLDSDSYGTSRGTGVLVRTADGWRIAQYHLTFPIPNALAREFTGRIREHERAAAPAR